MHNISVNRDASAKHKNHMYTIRLGLCKLQRFQMKECINEKINGIKTKSSTL